MCVEISLREGACGTRHAARRRLRAVAAGARHGCCTAVLGAGVGLEPSYQHTPTKHPSATTGCGARCCAVCHTAGASPATAALGALRGDAPLKLLHLLRLRSARLLRRAPPRRPTSAPTGCAAARSCAGARAGAASALRAAALPGGTGAARVRASAPAAARRARAVGRPSGRPHRRSGGSWLCRGARWLSSPTAADKPRRAPRLRPLQLQRLALGAILRVRGRDGPRAGCCIQRRPLHTRCAEHGAECIYRPVTRTRQRRPARRGNASRPHHVWRLRLRWRRGERPDAERCCCTGGCCCCSGAGANSENTPPTIWSHELGGGT